MLWITYHLWSQIKRFVFNFYQQQIRLMFCVYVGRTIFIPSKEGVAQGDPFVMALYGPMFLPLSAHLRRKFPEVLQPWSTNNGAMD